MPKIKHRCSETNSQLRQPDAERLGVIPWGRSLAAPLSRLGRALPLEQLGAKQTLNAVLALRHFSQHENPLQISFGTNAGSLQK